MRLTSVFLPGEFHGQRSLVGYSPWGGKESDTTEQLTHSSIRLYPQEHFFFLATLNLAKDKKYKSDG